MDIGYIGNWNDLTPAEQIQRTVQTNNSWSAEQAQKQMDFQREMSDTAHQREIVDLKAAGLNPVLSAKLGGASTPSGAMGATDTSGVSALIDLLNTSLMATNSAASAAFAASSKGSNGIENPLAQYRYKNPRDFNQMLWNFMIDQFGEGMYAGQNGLPFLTSVFGNLKDIADAIGFDLDEFKKRFQKKPSAIVGGANSSAASVARGAQGIVKGSGSGLWKGHSGHTTGKF